MAEFQSRCCNFAAKAAEFGWPEFGATAEKGSLNFQAGRRKKLLEQATTPPQQWREEVIEKTVRAYSAAISQPPTFTVGEELDWEAFKDELLLCLFDMNADAGSGVPYSAVDNRSTHGHWIHDPEMMPVLTALVWMRTNRLSKLTAEQLSHITAEEAVKQGLCDPVRVFIKGEPHKLAKLRDKRYRLIMSVSVADQLVARLLFRRQNRRELELHNAIPSKPGMGFSSDNQVSHFIGVLSDQTGIPKEEVCSKWRDNIRPTDCSGFDWSVQDWMLDDEMEVRNRLTHNCPEILKRMRAAWLHCLKNSVLMTSDGMLLAQTVPGIQKSGSFNTASSNSKIRYMLAVFAGAAWAITMGDDALEDCHSDLEVYKLLGVKCEETTELEFCSHIFVSTDVALPAGVGKMLFGLLNRYNPATANEECLQKYTSAVTAVWEELRHVNDEQMEELVLFLSIPEEQKRAREEEPPSSV
jgi:hypothetical protein